MGDTPSCIDVVCAPPRAGGGGGRPGGAPDQNTHAYAHLGSRFSHRYVDIVSLTWHSRCLEYGSDDLRSAC